MPTNRENMAELMQRLQDLYQQIENVYPNESKLIVEEHIHGLEVKLTEYLMFSCNDYNWRKQVRVFYRSMDDIREMEKGIDVDYLVWHTDNTPLFLDKKFIVKVEDEEDHA